MSEPTIKEADEFANWDLSSYFPEFRGDEYRRFKEELYGELSTLSQEARQAPDLTTDHVDAWAEIIVRLEDVAAHARHVASYLGCLRAADQTDDEVASEYAAVLSKTAALDKIRAYVAIALRDAEDDAFDALLEAPGLEAAAFFLRRARASARWTMSAALEELTADLSVDGFDAWGRLYTRVAGQLEFELAQRDGTTKTVPMSLRRSLMEDPDPAVRRSALVEGNKAWRSVEHTVAAALNAIAGFRLALYEHRGIEHFLDPPLFDACIERETLDAMLEAIDHRSDVPQDYLRLKARLLGRDRLGFQDLSAPLPIDGAAGISWGEARRRIVDAFSSSYPKLGEYAQMAFENDWIESEPREGKSPGGFCTSSLLLGESRIFMTYNRTLSDVQTLAHELGHAFHNHVMRDLRPYARRYPMTLAETASTFCETLLTDVMLAAPSTSDAQRAILLDTRLERASAFLLNIPVRYRFERQFYEERANGELTVARIKELMLQAQREVYGDTLAEEELDPYFWASKLHFFITGVSFYNFPYSFGYLFSMGVYQLGLEQPEGFHERYEQLLRMTGTASAETVARESIGADLTDRAFWERAIDSAADDLTAFRALVEGGLPGAPS